MLTSNLEITMPCRAQKLTLMGMTRMHEVCVHVHKYKWQWHAWLVAIGTECWQTCLETTLIVINNTIYK